MLWDNQKNALFTLSKSQKLSKRWKWSCNSIENIGESEICTPVWSTSNTKNVYRSWKLGRFWVKECWCFFLVSQMSHDVSWHGETLCVMRRHHVTSHVSTHQAVAASGDWHALSSYAASLGFFIFRSLRGVFAPRQSRRRSHTTKWFNIFGCTIKTAKWYSYTFIFRHQ